MPMRNANPIVMARRNSAAAAPPRLSVAAAFWRADPAELLDSLAPGMARLGPAVEIVLYDDGSDDPALTRHLERLIAQAKCPAAFASAREHGGPARARSALAALSRARHVLYLDTGLRAPDGWFLDRWLAVAAQQDPDVAFGGLTVRGRPSRAETRLDRYVCERSEAARAQISAEGAVKAAASSNLLVRREVLASAPFDERYSGGLDLRDVEWAMRVARYFDIVRVDNPAVRTALRTAEDLLLESRMAGPDFGRLAAAHPDAAPALPQHKAARAIARAPGHRALRPALERLACAKAAPLAIRHVAIQLYQASICAENLP